jgi:hypothetical protein
MSGDELRLVVAREHGLDEGTARFLRGETLTELEESAIALAKLLDREPYTQEPAPEQEPGRDAPDLFSAAARAKAERRKALEAAIAGGAPKPRDVRGRFSTLRGGFDGGARQPVRQQAPEDHGVWLVRLLRSRSADLGAGF